MTRTSIGWILLIEDFAAEKHCSTPNTATSTKKMSTTSAVCFDVLSTLELLPHEHNAQCALAGKPA